MKGLPPSHVHGSIVIMTSARGDDATSSGRRRQKQQHRFPLLFTLNSDYLDLNDTKN